MYERAHTHMMPNNILIRFLNETDKKATADLYYENLQRRHKKSS